MIVRCLPRSILVAGDEGRVRFIVDVDLVDDVSVGEAGVVV